MNDDWIDKELAAREKSAAKLAKRYADLRGLPYVQFLEHMIEEGVDLDFVTSSMLHKAINKP